MLEARAAGRRDGACTRLVSTYFDTPDRALAGRGVVLRVRERDGHFVQTVKTGVAGAAAGLARGEWEDPVDGPSPDPRAPESGRFVPRDAARRLVALFRTEVDRRALAICPSPGTEIEAAIDRGRIAIADGDAGEPICEVELELKRGQAAALYDVALELLAVAPVRLERRSKSERGYRLAAPDATPVAAVHAGPLDLDRSASGDAALQRIGRACLDQILQNEAAVRAGLADGVHQMRVGVRRLRAVLSAFGAMLPDEQRRWVSGELRWLGNALSPARNLDVFAATLVGPARQALGDIPGIARLAAAAEERRAAAYAGAAEALGSTRYAGLMLRLLRWFETCGWRDGAASHALDGPIGDIAATVLERRRRVALRHCEDFADQSPRQRHALRIALKKLRYATEMLGGLYEARAVGGFVKRLKALQDDLGDANDLSVARGIVAELGSPSGGGSAVAAAGAALLAWRERNLARRTPRLHRHLASLRDGEPFWAARRRRRPAEPAEPGTDAPEAAVR